MPGVRGSRGAVAPLHIDRAAHLDRVVAIEAATTERPWSERGFRDELARPDRIYLVALADGEVVGFGGIALQAGDAHVMKLAVDAAARGRGHGRRLVRGLLDAAVSRDVDGVTLEVRAGNDVATRLYRRAGFAVAGVRTGYYPDGEDAVIMWWWPPGVPAAADAAAPTAAGG